MILRFLLKLTNLRVSMLLFTGFLCLPAHSAPGDIDRSFDAGSGLDGWADVFTVQPDGKVIIAGPFTSVKGLTRRTFARLNADGTGDGSFAELDQNLGISGITGLVMQPDGKVLMGHSRGLDRFNSDGTSDAFLLRTYADGGLSRPVGVVALQPDGKILIGGDFSFVENTYSRGIARLNPNGHLDPTFDPGSGINDGFARVDVIAVQPDGKILIGGYMLGFNGTPVIHIARLHANGSLDHTFSPPFGVENGIYSMAMQPDGRILVGGYFDGVAGRSPHRIARLHADGSLDRSFDAGQALGAARQITLLPDGKILASGLVYAGNGSIWGTLFRLNTDGSPDISFHAAYGVERFALQEDGKLLVKGTADNGNTGLARLHPDGSVDAAFQPDGGVKGRVMSIAGQPDGKVLIGGSLTSINGVSRSGVARLNGNGTRDGSFVPAQGINASVHQIRLQPDGKVLVCGYSTTDEFVGTVRGGIIRLNADGSRDVSFDAGSGVGSGIVSLITLVPDGKILIGGSFNSVNGVSRPSLARLNADGSLDTAFNPDSAGIFSSLFCIAVQPDGKVLAGGYGGGLENGVIRGGLTRFNANGSVDSTFHSGRGGYVRSIAVLPGGKMVIGGHFSTVGAVTTFTSLARLHPDGSLDTGFFVPEASHSGVGVGPVSELLLQPDGKFLCYGSYVLGIDSEGYTTSMPAPYRLNADGSLDGTFYARLTGPAMELQADGRLLIGGGDLPGSNIGRLHGDHSTPSLKIALAGGSAVLSWSTEAGNLQLQETANLSQTGSWSPVAQTPVINGNQAQVTVPAAGPRRFFRLAIP